ncbi:hypothetical protein T4D_1012 [Trichinella pseudospiralis]|uniref:Uncharacterized protein n=1 Tax=Trichinella pseudospiralis TaxID=6337 RepID=A0A0V1FNG0_TRIPS|nr:hypothetical protein T4D_1012 [Trichinella pseudospiralis]
MHHSLTNHILIFDIEADIKLLAQSDLLPVVRYFKTCIVKQKPRRLTSVCDFKIIIILDTRLFFSCLPSCTSSVQLVDRGYQNVQCCGIARVFPAEITAGYQNSTLGRRWCSHVSQKSSCRLA